jgi:hypothetical protein
MVYPLLISKSKEFSQSISKIAAGGDTIEGTQISGYGDILSIRTLAEAEICSIFLHPLFGLMFII